MAGIQWGFYNGKNRRVAYPITFTHAFTVLASGGYSLIIPQLTGSESDFMTGFPYFARITDGSNIASDTGEVCQIYWLAIGK